MYYRYSLIIIFLAVCTAGCTSINRPEQTDLSGFSNLDADQTIGQTFLSRFSGLNGVILFLSLEGSERGTITLSLADGENKNTIIEYSTIQIPEGSSSGQYKFEFPPVQNSSNNFYYVSLEYNGIGSIKVGNSNGSTYLHGSSYINQIPDDAQLFFNLSYNPNFFLPGLIKEFLFWMFLLALGVFLFIIPGLGLLCLLWPKTVTLHWAEKLALSAGASLAVYALFFLWTHVTGINLGPIYAWLPPILGLALVLWSQKSIFATWRFGKFNPISSIKAHDLVLVFVIIMLFTVRFWIIRNLNLPLWGDSYQHTMISQLVIDNKGLFSSWLPYTPLSSFTYHFGFHSMVSVFHWVTNIPTAESVLWVGQITNGLAVLAVFPLAFRIGKNIWAGITAVTVVGLVFALPMIFVNWGRYTQLAGLIILPVFMYIFHKLMAQTESNKGLALLSIVALTGLSLTHLHIFLFALIFIAAELVLFITDPKLKSNIISTLLVLSGTLLLSFPWLFNLLNHHISRVFVIRLSAPPIQNKAQILVPDIELLTGNLPNLILVFTPIITAWGFWKRNRGIVVLCLWSLLILLASYPNWLNMPGLGVLNSFSTITSLYIPIGIIFASGLGWIFSSFIRYFRYLPEGYAPRLRLRKKWFELIFLMALIFVTLLGSIERRNDLEVGDYTLAAYPDEIAARWIAANLGQDARFLINSMVAFDGYGVVGTDGGWWLPLLAGRETTQPPVPYIIEDSFIPDFVQITNSLVEDIERRGINDSEVLEQLQSRKITHIYLGQQGGLVNSLTPMISPEELLSSATYNLIYHQDHVWIFEINYNEIS